ncbi:MAG: type I-C CRISPR-associated protein Cas8c/Csd1 [Bryobacteraceae bacterium]
MSWIQKLYETYELCANAPQFEKEPLLPVSHTEQQAHIEIILDQTGTFQRAAAVAKENTVFPATEESAGRTNRPVPHPICDKIQYCAADYKVFGGTKECFFEDYIRQLRQWQTQYPNAKVGAVLRYVEKGSVVADLVRAGVLHCGPDHTLLTEWVSEAPTPEIFKMLTAKEKKRDQGDAFVRWRVQVPGDPVSAVWLDPSVRDSWIRFVASQSGERGLCMVTGETAALTVNHPKRLRNPADKAKLISSNDDSGYTFRGRFGSPEQACGVGSAVSQKAHNALRWLITRQGYQSGDQVFVAWAVNGKRIPDPLADTARLLEAAEVDDTPEQEASYEGDAGQHYALRLGKAISGYRTKLGDADDVVVMGLDSATPGRMAITYYREMTGSEFLERIVDWHASCSWFQNYSRDNQFVGAPAPREIAEAAYGRRLDDNLRKSTVERLLPCIVDGRPLPRDVVRATVRRACKASGMKKKEKWEWEKCLGIACALVRGSSKEEEYQMALQEDRTTREYLFGRLLAIADNIEQRALHLANEQRDTNAAKLMQRFADRPCSTWRSIELALTPYKTRLRTNRPAVLLERDKLLDAVIGMFKGEDFISDSRLSGEFLLGYHCQRAALWAKGKPESEFPEKDESIIQEEGV